MLTTINNISIYMEIKGEYVCMKECVCVCDVWK